jgi:chitinase
LASGAHHNLVAIGGQWFKDNWNTVSSALAARPAIGSADGVSPDTPNDRVMECFGSYDYPDPLLPTDKVLNGAKASIMRLRRPAHPDRIRRLAETAVREDSQGAADDLLSPIHDGIAVFEYMNRPNVVQRFNMVRQQIRRQMGYIEQDVPGARGLVDWWDEFSRDYFALVGQRAREWATDVIHAAAEPFVEAQQNGRNLQTYGQVLGALEEMLNDLNSMRLPGDNSMPLPQPPGGGGTLRLAVV